MATLLKKFERFIHEEKLFESEHNLLVAVSGGMDSMVLAHLLCRAGYSISIAHCNFQLRGNDSVLDAEFVKNYAANMGLPYYQKEFDTRTYMAKHHLAVQEAARNLRYGWFDELMNQHDFDFLVTAHHANDQVETMLYNLIKGTGVAGLRGIPIQNEYIRRPLLFARREEIEKFAKQEELQWREDTSNQEDKYSRNRIRNQVIPELRQINPGLENTMQSNSKRFAAIEKLLIKEVSQIKTKWVKETKTGVSIKMDWYDDQTGGLAILHEILKAYGFNWSQSHGVATGFSTTSGQPSGNKYFSKEYTLFVDRKSLTIEPHDLKSEIELMVDEFENSITTPFHSFSLEVSESIDEWSTHNTEAYLDADLVHFPIKIRNWREGDAFTPLGMKGKKKLSDFMIDEKIPVNLKSRVVLFESNDEIVWVAGYRIADRYKITPNTKRVLIIKMTDHV